MSATPIPRPRKKTLLALLIVAGAVLLAVSIVRTAPEAEVEPVDESRFSVRTQTIEPGPVHPQLPLIAEVGSAAQPTLTAALAAEVQAVPVAEGQRVAAGEILVELDPRDAEVALSQARADLAQAEANLRLSREQAAADRANLERERELARLSESELARIVRLRERGLVAQTQVDQAKQSHQRALLNLAAREQAVARAPAQVDQAQARLLAAEAAVQSAELQQERTTIRAPFDAVITSVAVETGARVSPGSPLLSLYDARRLELRAELPTRQLSALQQARNRGQAVGGSVEFAGQSLRVELLRLGQSAQGGAVPVWLGLAEPGALPVGIRVPLALELPAVPQGVVLPESGLYDLSKVFRVVDGRLQSLVVTVHGRQQLGREDAVVISHPDLAAGDELLVTHLANAVTGLAVRELSP